MPVVWLRRREAINLQLSARVMQNYNDFVSGMQMAPRPCGNQGTNEPLLQSLLNHVDFGIYTAVSHGGSTVLLNSMQYCAVDSLLRNYYQC